MADRPPRRARFPLLRQSGEPRLSLLRRSLRGRLSGAASAPRPPPAPAPAVRRPKGTLERPSISERSAKQTRAYVEESAVAGRPALKRPQARGATGPTARGFTP